MNITAFSITPLFPDYDMGGAQKHLRYIALHLGERGHKVKILCTRRYDTPPVFQWSENVTVHATLAFRQPFPGPYDTGAHNLASIVQDISEHLRGADRFYIHDGEMLFPYLYEDIPTVISLRDNVYPETMMGAYLFRADTLVVISAYSRRFVQATVGRFFPDLDERIRVIGNGIDWTHFKPTAPGRIHDIIPVQPGERATILHPHRPEESKGIWNTIDVAEQLIKAHDLHDFRVLVPKWLGMEGDEGIRAFYERVHARLAEKGLSEHFIFHDWIPYQLLPEYYSLGAVTLSLGSFVESFGNSVYESLGCGTPTIAARIATHRELLPDNLLDKVDYGDIAGAARITAEIIRSKRRTSPETLAYLETHYTPARQLNDYAEAIESARVAAPMRFDPQPITPETRFALAPWCYVAQRGIYHDFRADYLTDDVLRELIPANPDGISAEQAVSAGVSAARFESWYRDGYLVPLRKG